MNVFLIFVVVSMMGMMPWMSNAVSVNITIGDTIDCIGLMPEILAGNAAAVQQVLEYCQHDERCSEMTGQSRVERAALFDMILQTIDSVGPYSGRSTLTPLLILICGKTLSEINAELWPLMIRVGMCDTDIACGFDDEPTEQLINPITGKVSCDPLPDRETADAYVIDAVTMVFGILLVFLMLILAGVAWYSVSVALRNLHTKQQLLILKQQRAK
jgi:hypothetical protein